MNDLSSSFAEKFGKNGTWREKDDQASLVRSQIIFGAVAGIGAAMLLLCIIMLVSFVWKVSDVCVEETDGFHSSEEILSASGIEVGDLMLGFDEKSVGKTLKENYPILKSVHIKRTLGGKVTLQIHEQGTLYYTCHHTNYYLISGENNRVLHISSSDSLYRAYGAIYVEYPKEVSLQVGDKVTYAYLPYEPVTAPAELSTYEIETAEASQEYAYVKEVISALEESPFFATLNGIDASNPYQIYFVCNHQVIVYLGDTANLERKISDAVKLINQNLSGPNVKAMLDVSNLQKVIYREDPTLEMPAWS